MEAASTHSIPTPFIWRRVHSLMGLWLVVYLLEHLLVNSQAALWIGDDGSGFVRLVNGLESLPYLQVIETLFIGIPLLIHGGWGIKRALTAKSNSSGGNGAKPALGQYSRNRAYTWQRITSWILLFGIVGHVIQMRFVDYPKKAHRDNEEFSLVKITFDEGLYTLAPRLHVLLYSQEQVKEMGCKEKIGTLPIKQESFVVGAKPIDFQADQVEWHDRVQKSEEENNWIKQLNTFKLKEHQVIAAAPNPGTAMLLSIRDTFKNPLMAILYTIFVLAAAFHAFNGFWTFLIAWGVILSYPSQKGMAKVSVAGILLLSFLGLAAIWGSYWNLRY